MQVSKKKWGIKLQLPSDNYGWWNIHTNE
jgi:hypothetical protein